MNTTDLHPYPDNPRIHGDGSGLHKSIMELGDLSGVVFNIRNQQLCGGHYRTKTIPPESIIESHPVDDPTGTTAEGTIILPTGQRLNYREVDWDEDRHKLACIEANNQKIQGEWNLDLLEPLLADLNEDLPEGDFEDFGLDSLADDFDFIMDEVGDFDPTLPTGDHPGIRTATFTFSEEQFQLVESAIKEIINETPLLDDPSGLNENKNGNALYWICKNQLEK